MPNPTTSGNPDTNQVAAAKQPQDCFVLMPISDPEDHATGHFKAVYEDIITPACEMAGYRAVRADNVKANNPYPS